MATGDNLYAASRIGIDPSKPAKIKWHFQTTPREGWDYDGVNEVVAYTNRDGEKRWATADRNGFFYVLNRDQMASSCSRPDTFRQRHHLGRRN